MPINKRHYRITIADALSAHDRALSVGGRQGILNLDMIESAIARPYTGYYRSIEKKAAALTESMARNHGFVDGNKRTTLILVYTLLTKSGYELGALGNDINLEIEELILGAAAGKPFVEIATWFTARLRRM